MNEAHQPHGHVQFYSFFPPGPREPLCTRLLLGYNVIHVPFLSLSVAVIMYDRLAVIESLRCAAHSLSPGPSFLIFNVYHTVFALITYGESGLCCRCQLWVFRMNYSIHHPPGWYHLPLSSRVISFSSHLYTSAHSTPNHLN